METENDVNGDDIDSFEEQYFYNLDATRTSALSGANSSTQTDDGCTSCNESALTNGTTKPVGPAILLDVMSGDELDLEAWAYNQGSISTGTSRIATSTLATSLASAFVPSGNIELINQTQSLFNGITGDITGGGSSGTTRPFAYLNYILFDSEFNVISDGHDRVQDTPNTLQLTSISNISISEKGFIYIWVSNESNQNMNVYWDDIKITHTKGQILQEDHYYPFGLNINALSSSAPMSMPNKFKYNGFEEQTDFDLGWYDYQARFYDPQLGRFMQVDPAADFMRRHSAYNYAFDNPIRFIDPDGMMPEDQVTYGSGGSPFDNRKHCMYGDCRSSDPSELELMRGYSNEATCPTCPETEEFESHRKSDFSYTYKKGIGAFKWSYCNPKWEL